MATIIEQSATCDGYNVSLIVGGNKVRLHFLAEPSEAELAEKILEFESRLLDEIAETILNQDEEYDI